MIEPPFPTVSQPWPVASSAGFTWPAGHLRLAAAGVSPTQLLPAYAAEDHLHVNDAGNVAQGNAIPLTLFQRH